MNGNIVDARSMVLYMRSTGLSYREIADKAGCDPSTARRIAVDPDMKVRSRTFEGLIAAYLTRKQEFSRYEQALEGAFGQEDQNGR